MSKILAILFLFLIAFLPNRVFAADDVKACPVATVRTAPEKLYSDPVQTPRAKFSVNLSGLAKNTDYSNWEMEFECGGWLGWSIFGIGQTDRGKASIEPSNDVEIFREIDHSSTGCQFSPGNDTIKVWAGNTPQCRATYTVIDSDTQCQLHLNPETGITSDTDLTISGDNLSTSSTTPFGPFFGVFIDDKVLKGTNATDFIRSTTNFSGVKIPKDLLTPGFHTVNLRRYNGIPTYTINPRDYGSPLCPLIFSVGSISYPGSVVTKGTTGTINTGPPAGSGGKDVPGCTDTKDPNDPTKPNPNPGIATAIGCIHTNPVEFVKDMMKFLLGISGGITFLMMLIGTFQMLTSAGNPDTLRAGRERLTSAVIGLLFVIFAVLLLQIIGVQILSIPGFKNL